MAMENSRQYSVFYEIEGTEKKYKSRTTSVMITEGYSTFEDIRKILAIRLGLKPENIRVRTLVEVE